MNISYESLLLGMLIGGLAMRLFSAKRAAADSISLNREIAHLATEKKVLEEQLVSFKKHVDELSAQNKLQFENLANQIIENKSKSFTEYTEKTLESMLKPFKEKITNFEKSVEDKYSSEARERHALKSEILRLISLNDRMSEETNSLARALRGDSKVQGDWGEMVLSKILEASGLREGEDYITQSSHKNEEGDRLRPDVIINLPDEKHVVVDAKVSLKAYDLHHSSTEDVQKEKCLSEHIRSIDKHINELSEKHYDKLKGLSSPEIVFMFVPIEPAYLLAMHADADLSMRAWKKGVAIVTATTLLTSLKTVASIWRLERQNKNAQEIAQEGARLYDKFVGFLEDFEKIGHIFETGSKQFSQAMGKLKDGPGNVFRKMELLRELGASPNKKIRQDLLE
ncbi:MAG: hypothetical protein A2504_07680 [Bdellovibrionales bacterium RIFOXYD12_FULL_39_22]|nr:MAG: hypothetical protein A2385_11005 [Bdellovibrionales bacterium RIFOXYB1_FULL_39_21]OFZ41290.1 MAG: hypothetical protein A2485_00680 [Bdellovibrionales bacterium RIFOXYC12_FULL_39_17]OFZ45060.1 MAG: hypothetical protein A2404_11300 [Bdellovibrionales bacterium RIFOXYC1_FULL_39_130]OFZ73248.1 MAG: hypothetical protein A2451_08900 [Bdellovibrionales bacterium RIFOXYC2_FULL_39_8]OFZ74444.1 MAG: hypothetical protein A2560_11335 [Bdellovibrionales bacterium RIFOXYD1_FULL_39_84]OFZ92456.1 MAG: